VPAAEPSSGVFRRHFLIGPCWAFTLFNTVRAAADLPTVRAIVQSGHSSQHSLWTWFTWAGADAPMAAWLYETHGQRPGRADAARRRGVASRGLRGFHRPPPGTARAHSHVPDPPHSRSP